MKPQRIRRWALTGGVIGALVLAGLGAPTARAAEPIRIGFGMALTGGLSANGKPALLAVQIWKDDVNKRGGLLGRPVELVYYDDQTNPATVPGIYTKLLDVDKVDLVISGYGTNLIAPLMPIAMERKLTIMGMFGLANNEKYQYPRSEEHTSELQSRLHLVCRLLLEKKKNTRQYTRLRAKRLTPLPTL